MMRSEFLNAFSDTYALVKIFSQKNSGFIAVYRNKAFGKNAVIRSYPEKVSAYEILKNIRHPNLPEIYDVYNLDDGQIIIEEYIEGITVADVLSGGKYTYGGAKKVISGLCDALSFLHGKGVIHRDIKPENVIISHNGIVKLIDLNASREYAPEKKTDTVTLGTIGYAPPEQFGISQTTAAADIYSLGVLLNVMLTGNHPSVITAKGKSGRIVRKCTVIDPESRFESAEKLKRAL